MNDLHIGEMETRFAELIWENEPLHSRDLVALCEREFNWKRTTTLTVLKKLSDKGMFQNVKTVVTSLMSKDEFYAQQSHQFVRETFQGSLPAFIAAFTSGKKLSEEEVSEIRAMIDRAEQEV